MKHILFLSTVFSIATMISPITAFAEERVAIQNSTKPQGDPLKAPPNKYVKEENLTSTDLYCETLTITFFEQVLNSAPPKSDAHAEKIKSAEREMQKTCKSMPTIGGKEKKLKEMSPRELSQLTCLAVADGISTAHYSQNQDHLLYAELSQKRQFFMDACASNSKQLLTDMKKFGPYHVLKKVY